MILNVAENMMLTFMICHMVGVSSACTNPILYGFLNDNFVKEFNLLCPFLATLPLFRPKLGQHRKGGEKTTLLPPSNNVHPQAILRPATQAHSTDQEHNIHSG